MKKITSIITFIGLLCYTSADAQDIKAFHFDSRLRIEKAHIGQPFILAFWSLDCTYCVKELNLLGQFVSQHPSVKLILVNTDGRSASRQVIQALHLLQLPKHYQAWQFAEEDEERLRYSVDQRWYGELPRTYYYDTQHQVTALSGSPEWAWLNQWGLSLKP